MKAILKVFLLIIITLSPAIGQVKMSEKQKHEFLKDLVTSFETEYLWEEEGKSIAEKLGAKIKNGDYANIENAELFVGLLSRDLYLLSNDLHLTVDLYAPEPSEKETPISASNKTSFIHKESIKGSIAYLKLDDFPRMSESREKEIADIMSSLTSSSHIIIDLRDNAGGSDETVNHLIGYFFEDKTMLATSQQWGQPPREIWSSPKPPSKQLADIPLIILTSQSTFSAAEIFTQRLQKHNRATVVGEPTPGAAHRTATYLMSDIFLLNWPYEASKHAKTGQDLENEGIRPDYLAHYNEAKKTAIQLATSGNVKATTSLKLPKSNRVIKDLLKALNTTSDTVYQGFQNKHVLSDSREKVSGTLQRYNTVWNDKRDAKLVNFHQLSDNQLRVFLGTDYGTRQIKLRLNEDHKIIGVMTR